MTDDPEVRGLKTRNELQETLSQDAGGWWQWLFARMAEPSPWPEDARVLELAAGAGEFWAKNRERVPASWRLLLSDVAFGMVQAARQALELEEPGAALAARRQYCVADVQAAPVAGGRWDVVLANGVFDYLQPAGRRAAFSEIRRVLAPGGRLCTVSGGRGHLSEIEALVRPFVPDADYGGEPEAFGSENGAAQLAPWFPSVYTFTYEDSLEFRSPEPLLAYVLSESQVRRRLAPRQREALGRRMAEEMAGRGEIRATICKTLFVAFCE